MIQNQSGIEPTEYKVLVKPDKVEEKTKGGIIIPETERDRVQLAATTGILVAASPMAFKFDEWPPDARKPQPGDRVAFPRYTSHIIKGKDEQDYWLVNDKDVSAILWSK